MGNGAFKAPPVNYSYFICPQSHEEPWETISDGYNNVSLPTPTIFTIAIVIKMRYFVLWIQFVGVATV